MKRGVLSRGLNVKTVICWKRAWAFINEGASNIKEEDEIVAEVEAAATLEKESRSRIWFYKMLGVRMHLWAMRSGGKKLDSEDCVGRRIKSKKGDEEKKLSKRERNKNE